MPQSFQNQDPRHVGTGAILAVSDLVNLLNDFDRQWHANDLPPLGCFVVLTHRRPDITWTLSGQQQLFQGSLRFVSKTR